MRRTAPLLILLLLALVPVTLSAISTIKAIRIADGYDAVNRLTAPVVDPAQAPALRFTVTAAYDRNAKIVRRGATGIFTRGPEYNLDKSVNMAAHLDEALRAESVAMGFKNGSGDDVWQVEATIRNVYLESKQIPYGATLFYGFLAADVQVRRGTDAPTTVTLRFHDYVGDYNAGAGRRDEAEAALSHLLVEAAQDLIGRLNRTTFRAVPHVDVARLVDSVGPGATVDRAALHRLGLSTAPSAVSAIVATVTQEDDENRRSALIDLLADLGDPAAVAPLAGRYGTEDEDCRWYTLKAMDYIGGDAAMAVVRDQGLRDADGGPRRLAERITGATGR